MKLTSMEKDWIREGILNDICNMHEDWPFWDNLKHLKKVHAQLTKLAKKWKVKVNVDYKPWEEET